MPSFSDPSKSDVLQFSLDWVNVPPAFLSGSGKELQLPLSQLILNILVLLLLFNLGFVYRKERKTPAIDPGTIISRNVKGRIKETLITATLSQRSMRKRGLKEKGLNPYLPPRRSWKTSLSMLVKFFLGSFLCSCKKTKNPDSKISSLQPLEGGVPVVT